MKLWNLHVMKHGYVEYISLKQRFCRMLIMVELVYIQLCQVYFSQLGEGENILDFIYLLYFIS